MSSNIQFKNSYHRVAMQNSFYSSSVCVSNMIFICAKHINYESSENEVLRKMFLPKNYQGNKHFKKLHTSVKFHCKKYNKLLRDGNAERECSGRKSLGKTVIWMIKKQKEENTKQHWRQIVKMAEARKRMTILLQAVRSIILQLDQWRHCRGTSAST